MEEAREPRPWRRLDREPGPDLTIFRARFDLLENPRTGEVMRRTVLETPDWVNVVATTPEGRFVLVRQYRFGTAEVCLEIPGGVIDRGESSEQAARRELLEETGYAAPRWRYLGRSEPNPAFQDNVCHHWLAEGAVVRGGQELDAGEDIAVVTLPEEDVLEAIRRGEMLHSLVLCALGRVIDLRRVGPSAGDE